MGAAGKFAPPPPPTPSTATSKRLSLRRDVSSAGPAGRPGPTGTATLTSGLNVLNKQVCSVCQQRLENAPREMRLCGYYRSIPRSIHNGKHICNSSITSSTAGSENGRGLTTPLPKGRSSRQHPPGNRKNHERKKNFL